MPFQPTFRLISTSPNKVKSEAYQTNADDLVHTLGVDGAVYLNGGLNDNANDAQLEILSTVEEIKVRAHECEDLAVGALTSVNGVDRRPIKMGDGYHWGALACMHASWGMAGDTVNGEHRQCHHRQLLMSMHSLHSKRKRFSQAMMDRAMSGQERVLFKTWRERQQRWLVNQRFAAYVLTLLNVVTTEGVMCIIAWALYFSNKSRSDWRRQVGTEIAVWLSMPAIILGLHFEAELGNYFEQVYDWHNRKGPFHNRSGF